MKTLAMPSMAAMLMSAMNMLSHPNHKRPEEMTPAERALAALPRVPDSKLATMHREIQKGRVRKGGKYKKAFVHPSIWHHPDAVAARKAEKEKYEGSLFSG